MGVRILIFNTLGESNSFSSGLSFDRLELISNMNEMIPSRGAYIMPDT